MNDSESYYEISRTIYKLKQGSSKTSRYVAVRNMQVFFKRPFYITKRALETLFTEPGRLVRILTGRAEILDFKDVRNKQLSEYEAWIRGVEKKQYDPEAAKKEIKNFKHKPKVSLITPIFNPPVWALEELIESVLSQVYENYELLLFDFGNSQEVSRLIDDYAARETRIIVQKNLENRGISGNSNYSLQYASGEFVGLLDHDDLLEPNTLFECVKAINKQANQVDFIYTDKDKITEDGVRFDPQLKPDFSPEMLLTANYLTHFDLMRKTVLEKVGGWEEQTDGAQDWDLFLKISEHTKRIIHIPKILYHWRTVKNSTANNIDVKPYVRKAQMYTITNALQRRGFVGAKPHQERDGQMYINWQQNPQPLVFLLHGLYVSSDIEKLMRHIKKQPDFQPKSTFAYFVLENDIKPAFKRHLTKKFPELTIIEYRPGVFLESVQSYLKNNKGTAKQAVYMSDSLSQVASFENYWISQLTGWLSVDEISVASGRAVYHDTVIDCGSVYSKAKNCFSPLFTGTLYTYDIIGYVQWTRNLLAPSKRFAAFDIDLLSAKLLQKNTSVRDDEFAVLLGLIANANGKRVVYDPSLRAHDTANFILTFGASDGIKQFLKHNLPDVLTKGDPYLNSSVNSKRIGITLTSEQDETLDVVGSHITLIDA